MGALSGFDRLVFRGTLRRLAHRGGMMSYLWSAKVLLKDFREHVLDMSGRVKAASEALAEKTGRPLVYLPSSATDKEAAAREIARRDGVGAGLVCIFSAVEPCSSYEIVRNRKDKRLDLEPAWRKCLHLYHYQLHPQLGFMHARIQTWFPFSIQICLNGREWLARAMDEAELGYVRRENCFTWLEDACATQRLMDRQLQAAWPELLSGIARSLNPGHDAMFSASPMDYYWSTHQSEWATDILFRDAASLERLYPRLVRHGLESFLSPDVMRFLGRKVPASGKPHGRLEADVVSDMKTRPEGVRIKHRLGSNSIKMYDKQASVLRVETTINDAAGFKVFRKPEGQPAAEPSWRVLRRGIADLHRRAQLSQAANDRYFEALACVDDTTALGELASRICRPVLRPRRARALNPLSPDDARLLEAVGRGELTIGGLRNRDLRRCLFHDEGAPHEERRRRAAAVTRKLALLRAHRLVRKVPRTHRYLVTREGRTVLTALAAARNASTASLTRLAA
jgi:hypothetical protein